MSDLEKVRREDFACTANDITLGVVAMASPIFSSDGSVKACIDLRGPEFRLTKGQIKKIKPLIQNAALEISKELGYQSE